MALSKSTRIIILLAVDTVFFLLELTVGYYAHSLALVADSFHMLNDILSLCVGLWAVKKVQDEKTQNKKTDLMYTYGWQQAETLGALINGVFLVALCLSIFLEAIKRLFEPQEVKNPKLVLIVGSLGLLSNLFGLALFHDHSHGHDDHESIEGLDDAERGYNVSQQRVVADERGTVASGVPENVAGVPVDRFKSEETLLETHPRGFSRSDETTSTEPVSSPSQRSRAREIHNRHPRRYSGSASRFHPVNLRQGVIDAEAAEATEHSGLLCNRDRAANYTDEDVPDTSAPPEMPKVGAHKSHNHTQLKAQSSKKGHGHRDLNMRGVFLHVMGDALGNIGVIAAALIIWLTDFPWRFYVDPGISLLITVIILCSAIPLCKAASRILLLAAPVGMSINLIEEDIRRLDGVADAHHLHVWQLSDTKLVASLHIIVDGRVEGEGSDSYMELAKKVRECLHGYGIHSSTIQPEFTPQSPNNDPETHSASSTHPKSRDGGAASVLPSRTASFRDEPGACLLKCGDECREGVQCCPNSSK